MRALVLLFLVLLLLALPALHAIKFTKHGTAPVFEIPGSAVFDVSVLSANNMLHMWFSWRSEASIGYANSTDGVSWSAPVRVLMPRPNLAGQWEQHVNRGAIVKHNGQFLMWYTGQNFDRQASAIGFARSVDGITWRPELPRPVMSPTEPWEITNVMCPDVMVDRRGDKTIYRMWYSGGEFNEPNAIGYAESFDGVSWVKSPDNPIFVADPSNKWEAHKVTATNVHKVAGVYLMFYICFADEGTARICAAASRDGISRWQRHPANPILEPSPAGSWDSEAVYKPAVVKHNDKLMLFYNGRTGFDERIGLALAGVREVHELLAGFDRSLL